MAVVILAVGFVLLRPDDKDNNNNQTTPDTTNQQTTNEPEAANNQADNDSGSVQTVIYDQNGFSPEMLTSKVGEKMNIENKSSSTIEVNSDPHPSHTENPELNVGAIEPGATKSVTLTTTGTFGFHNHLQPDEKARVVVQ